MRFFIVFLLSFVLIGATHAATWDIRLVMKSGTLDVAGGGTISYELYTSGTTFPKCSDLFIWQQGDLINLKVVNELPDVHGFVLDGYVDYGTILSGDSVEQQFTVNQLGVFRYYDPVNAPYNAYMGLHGIAHVKAVGDLLPYFYWEIREMQEDWNVTIPLGGTPSLTDYDPKFFTINGNYNPNINLDPVARVLGTAGNEFRIVMVNNGLSTHSMHFHGYHLTVEEDSYGKYQGRSKDTFPLFSGESMVLSCIPDKGGEYPVHDHNLVAVTGNSTYPNGMFTSLLIAP